MTVMVQVHVSRAQLAFSQQSLKTASRYAQVQDRLVDLTRSARQANQESPQKLIREELNALLAEVRFDLAYADTQNAFANLYSAMGLDNFTPEITGNESVAQLSAALRGIWEQRRDPHLIAAGTRCAPTAATAPTAPTARP